MKINRITKQNIALLLFFLSPLFVPYLIVPRVFTAYSISAFLLCLCAVVYSGKRTEQAAVIPTKPFILFCLLIVSLIVGFILHPFSSIYGNIEVPMLILTAFIAFFCTATNRLSIKALQFTYLIASILWVLVALPVWLGWTDGMPLHLGLWALTTDPQGKINGPFTNGNVMAILIAVAWVISVFYWLKNRHSYLWWLLQTFFWLFIVVSMSRGAWLAQASILVWLIIFLIRDKAYKQLAYLFVAGLIAWTAGSALLSYQQQNVTYRFGERSAITIQKQLGMAQDRQHARIVLWRSAFEMWKEHPWLGVGAGRFDAHFLDAQATALASMEHPKAGLKTAFNSAHNLLLHLMAELGLIGILLWLSITLLLAQNIWRYRYRLLSPQWPALAAASMLWIQGMFNISMTNPFPVLLFALLLGISYAPEVRKNEPQGKHGFSIPKAYLTITAGSLAVFMFLGAASTASAWLRFEKWMYMEVTNPIKGSEAVSFIGRDDILPHLIQTSVNEHYLSGNHAAVGKLQPLISQALSVHQHPTLLRQLFFSHAIRGEFELACTTGRRIEMQYWPNEINTPLYQAACENKLSRTLEIQN